jgi:hypothetical protein
MIIPSKSEGTCPLGQKVVVEELVIVATGVLVFGLVSAVTAMIAGSMIGVVISVCVGNTKSVSDTFEIVAF